MGGKEGKKLHIVMYPWLAFGHMTAFLHLANKLAQKRHKVSFFLPPKVEKKLAPLNRHPNLITFISVAVPAVDGLPNDAQTTNDIPNSQARPLLVTAMELTRPSIESSLSHLRPHVVFFDYAYWMPALAHKYGAKAIFFSTIFISSYTYMSPRARALRPGTAWPAEDLMRAPVGFPASSSYRYLAYEARQTAALSTLTLGLTGISFWDMIYAGIENSDALCCKGCREIEGQFGDYFQMHYRKQVLWAGPVLPEESGSGSDGLDEKLEGWLNGFDAGTVVYCALGSECVLSKHQFQELVLGLEFTGLPFLAVLKSPQEGETMEFVLPKGFSERVKERGTVHDGWIPQHVILKHPSIGCFVTHCGAGSLSEALVSQCQTVLLPQAGDQYSNARLMGSELRVGVEVERREEDGFFSKEGISNAVMTVMTTESKVGIEIRANHDKWRKFLSSEGLEDSYINDFVSNLRGLIE